MQCSLGHVCSAVAGGQDVEVDLSTEIIKQHFQVSCHNAGLGAWPWPCIIVLQQPANDPGDGQCKVLNILTSLFHFVHNNANSFAPCCLQLLTSLSSSSSCCPVEYLPHCVGYLSGRSCVLIIAAAHADALRAASLQSQCVHDITAVLLQRTARGPQSGHRLLSMQVSGSCTCSSSTS